jgi:hypothetical protein
MILVVVAAVANGLSAETFKVERGGIEKDQIHFGKQIVPALLHLLN